MGIGSRLRDIATEQVRPASLLGAGAEAPEFDLEASDGSRVRSAGLLGDGQYVLVFYPQDGPAAAARLRVFEEHRARFAEQRCRLFGIAPGSRRTHEKLAREAGLGFPLLVDRSRRAAMAFRTARRGLPATFAAVFLVDERGIIRLAMKGWPAPEAVLQAAERSNQTGFKGTGRRGRRRVPEVSATGLRRLRQEEPGTVVLDVRVEADWRTGHVPGAINVPIDELERRLGELPDRATPVVVVCDQGLRAPGAAWMLRSKGWRRPYTLVDGMAAWKGSLEAG